MNDFQIGEKVELNGKTYTIVGIIKRSYKLERDGKFYKATASQMQKIQNHEPAQPRKLVDREAQDAMALESRIRYAKLWDANFKSPESREEIMKFLRNLAGELSPENLSCDGECSRSEVAARRASINACWTLERKLGKKVSQDEAEDWGR